MDSSAVIQIHVVRFLQICMAVVHFTMEFAASMTEPAVPHNIVVCLEGGVSRYVLWFIANSINLSVPTPLPY
jgi:hypothetical protein